MEFRVLGPLEVIGTDGHAQSLGGPRQRAVLAALLLRLNTTVSVDDLVEDVWGEEPPATARHTLEAYVSRLRGILAGHDGIGIERRPTGYRLRLPQASLDLHRFERLSAEGRRAFDDGESATAFRCLQEALSLWCGPALADVVLCGSGRSEPARLDELRLRSQEDLIRVRLAHGEHEALLGELEALLERHPFRERLRAQLMLALYRSGRQADALACYEAGRRALQDALGLKPGRELQRLAGRIVRQEPELDAAEAPRKPPERPRVVLLRWASTEMQSALTELQREGLRRAALAYGVETERVSVAAAFPAFRRELERAAGRSELVLAAVSSMAPIVAAVAPRFPDTRFVVFDTSVLEPKLGDNVTGVVFADEQVGFLAGYLGALMGEQQSRSPVVSAIAGPPVPAVERLLAGYEAGARHAVPDARVLVDYIESWLGHDQCERLANEQIDRGSIVVFAVAGPSSSAALEAAELRGVWGLGVDDDQSYLGTQILASAVKRFDHALLSIVKSYVDGELPAGDVHLDLSRGGVGLVGINPAVPGDVRERLARVAALVRSGALRPPTERPRS